MGTPRQADALIKIMNSLRRKEFAGELPSAEEAELRARILAMTHGEVQAAFKRVNAVTGFDRDTSPATPDQMKRIRQLEVAAYGKARSTYRDCLTFEQAHHYLDELVRGRSQTMEEIRAVESYANGSAFTTPAASALDA